MPRWGINSQRTVAMDKDEISRQLRKLATSDESRGKTARLRDVFDDVELALSSGVSRALVLETLEKNGLSMTPKGFDSALSRIRASRKKGPAQARSPTVKPAAPAAPAPQQPPGAPVGLAEANAGSHDPADLDKIISQKPDLTALAKLATSSKRNQK